MSKTVKIIIIILIIDLVLVAGYFIYKAVIKGKSDDIQESYEWIEIDEFYTPRNFIEEFIKKDSAERGLFPVYIKKL
ncbi:MAG: hypothetical protein ACOC57_05125 [Acidobacteriota bacterium]